MNGDKRPDPTQCEQIRFLGTLREPLAINTSGRYFCFLISGFWSRPPGGVPGIRVVADFHLVLRSRLCQETPPGHVAAPRPQNNSPLLSTDRTYCESSPVSGVSFSSISHRFRIRTLRRLIVRSDTSSCLAISDPVFPSSFRRAIIRRSSSSKRFNKC